MIENICYEDTFFTVANWAGDPAIVTVGAVCQIGREFVQVGGGLAGLLEHLITIGDTLSQYLIDCLLATFRFFCGWQLKFV